MAEPPIRNERPTAGLRDAEVAAALARLSADDVEVGREAEHVYEALTWGEGPAVIDQAGLQHWLWWELTTKYLNDEPEFTARYAEVAARLFDELGLHRYAAIARSDTTAEVHAAFARSRSAGRRALLQAIKASGVEPAELDDFAWGDVFGAGEADARSAVSRALEAAIDAGELVPGAKGSQALARSVTARTLDEAKPGGLGDTWRQAVVTERLETWIRGAERHEPLHRLRAGVANALLHPIEPPPDVAEVMAPLCALLERFGPEQRLTQAGYLAPAFVREIHEAELWDEELPIGVPRTETDEPTLHRLRGFLTSAGALRRSGKSLKRTKRGTAMAADPAAAWHGLVAHLGASEWERFVTETCLLPLVATDAPVPWDELRTLAGEAAPALGWRSSSGGETRLPGETEVSWAFADSRILLELFGMLVEHGDWRDRSYSLTPAGRTTALALLRHTAAGPKDRAW
ncbi:MAG: hypothetical protein R2726_18825 [Acidimicrobiales bacterium]